MRIVGAFVVAILAAETLRETVLGRDAGCESRDQVLLPLGGHGKEVVVVELGEGQGMREREPPLRPRL